MPESSATASSPVGRGQRPRLEQRVLLEGRARSPRRRCRARPPRRRGRGCAGPPRPCGRCPSPAGRASPRRRRLADHLLLEGDDLVDAASRRARGARRARRGSRARPRRCPAPRRTRRGWSSPRSCRPRPGCPPRRGGRARGTPSTMPTEMAAQNAVSGWVGMMPGHHDAGQRVVQGDVAAADRRGAGAAVGLEHVAVDDHLALPQQPHVAHRPQRAADQALDLLGAARRLAVLHLAADALRRAARAASSTRR